MIDIIAEKIGFKRKIDVKEIYTPFSIANKEIKRRWNDKELRTKVEKFLENDFPSFLKDEPKVIMSRHVASPNYDTAMFLALAKESGLSPVFYEHVDDAFYAGNTCKYHLYKMFFFDGMGKKGGMKIDTLRITDMGTSEGKKIKDATTIWGENLVEFHNRLFRQELERQDMKCEIHDVDGWYKRKGIVPEKYYLAYLALFLCHGILFENFLTNEEEYYFTKNVVLKNIKKIQKIFGIKPLIVPISSLSDEENIYWQCYSRKLRSEIEEKIQKIYV